MVNEQIGDYRLIRLCGRGGVGSVWEAETRAGTPVALKILNPLVSQNRKVVTKFRQEASILARLEHPHITRLLEFISNNDNDIIVMEYVQGVDLKTWLSRKQGPPPFEWACNIAGQILDACQYAYESGILHRDIKPGNIMIDYKQGAKLMDFGIASMSAGTAVQGMSSAFSIGYAAPERFDSPETGDVRSDIYSSGLVFYELFTGCRTFAAMAPDDLRRCHQEKIPVPPRARMPELPQALSRAISVALEKNAADRHQDFQAFGRAMQIGWPHAER